MQQDGRRLGGFHVGEAFGDNSQDAATDLIPCMPRLDAGSGHALMLRIRLDIADSIPYMVAYTL